MVSTSQDNYFRPQRQSRSEAFSETVTVSDVNGPCSDSKFHLALVCKPLIDAAFYTSVTCTNSTEKTINLDNFPAYGATVPLSSATIVLV